MPKKIQTQFTNLENGNVYHEIYFTFVTQNALNLSDYQMIESVIELELLKINIEKQGK